MIKCCDSVRVYSWAAPNTFWSHSVYPCACLLHSCLAKPETQLLALIDFSDREDFPVQGHTPSNRLRSLLADKETPSPWSNGTFQPVCWWAGCKKRLGVQGMGLAAHARQSFTVGESNCTRHLQTPRSWQRSTPFLCPGFRGLHDLYKNHARSFRRLSKTSVFSITSSSEASFIIQIMLIFKMQVCKILFFFHWVEYSKENNFIVFFILSLRSSLCSVHFAAFYMDLLALRKAHNARRR